MKMPAVLKTCGDVRDFLMDYLDQKLPKGDAFKFRVHMFICPKCKKYLSRYDTSVKLAKNILNDPPPLELINLTREFLDKNLTRENS